MTFSAVVYVVIVSSIGLASLAWALLWLNRADETRRNLLSARTWFEGIKTRTPLKDAGAQTRAQGLDNIRRNTTVIRRSMVPLILFVTALLAAAPLLGELPTAVVSVVVGLVSVTAGIAARPVLENVFSGLVISFSRLINIGDTVMIDENYGTVEDVTLTHTTVRVWNWERYVVPNSKVLQSPVRNYSLHDHFIWAHIEFWVSYEADLDEVKRIAIEAAEQSENYAGYEAPRFWVMEMGERGVQCWVAAWANTASAAWTLRNEIRTGLATSMRRKGIGAHLLRVVSDRNEVPVVAQSG